MKKSFSVGQVKGEGSITPVAVEAETNTENSILWRHPKEEDIGGLDLLVWELGGAE